MDSSVTWLDKISIKATVELGKSRSIEIVTFDPAGIIRFESQEEVPMSSIVSISLEKFGTCMVVATAKKSLKITVDKGLSESLLDASTRVDDWCQEHCDKSYKPIKGKTKKKGVVNLLTRRKSSASPSLGRTSGSALAAAANNSSIVNKKRTNSVSETSSDDDDGLSHELESMKTGFLQYRRMQLKAQVVASDEKGGSILETELAEIRRLEAEWNQVKSELDQKRSLLDEREKQYFGDGKVLANEFTELAKHVGFLGKGPLASVFRDLQAEYTKSLGLDDDENSSGSGEEESVPVTPVKSSPSVVPIAQHSPTLTSSPAMKRATKLERSDSTIGWVRARPTTLSASQSSLPQIAPSGSASSSSASGGSISAPNLSSSSNNNNNNNNNNSNNNSPAGGASPAAGHVVPGGEGITERFRAVVGTLESALYLNRPMDNLIDAVKERSRRLQAEIDDMLAQMDNANTLVQEEEGRIKELQENLALAKSLAVTLNKISSGSALNELRSWIMTSAASQDTMECVTQLKEAKLQRHQAYLDVISKDYVPPRDAIELSEDGSLFGCRSDVLFELLVSGVGAQRFPDFDLAFLYGFRAWMPPVTLLERLMEVFCTTPVTNMERTSIHMARLRVLRLLSTWIELHDYDVSEKRFSALMHSFLDTVSIAGYDDDAKKLRSKMTGNFFYDNEELDRPYPASIPVADPRNFTFLDIDPLELARQLTLQDAALYQGMQTRELLDCQWTKAGGSKAPTVLVITKRFNDIAAWVVGTILREEDVQRRAQVVTNFVRTAEHLLALQNFNGVMQIIASLSKTEVVRLKRTQAALSKETRKSFENLHSLLDKNCARLRELYRESNPPSIPYIGTFMTDLTFIGEMKPRLPNGMICYRKLHLQAASLDALLGRRGQMLYRLKEVKEVRDFIGKRDVMFTEDEAYNRSLALEPRDSSRSK